MGRDNFEEKKGRPIAKYTEYRPLVEVMRPFVVGNAAFCQLTLTAC